MFSSPSSSSSIYVLCCCFFANMLFHSSFSFPFYSIYSHQHLVLLCYTYFLFYLILFKDSLQNAWMMMMITILLTNEWKIEFIENIHTQHTCNQKIQRRHSKNVYQLRKMSKTKDKNITYQARKHRSGDKVADEWCYKKRKERNENAIENEKT